MFRLNASCIGVCLNRLLSTLCGFASRLISMNMRIPSRSHSSRRSAMPSIRFSLTRSAIFSRSAGLVDLVGQLGHDDRGPVALDVLERDLRPDRRPGRGRARTSGGWRRRVSHLAGDRVALPLEADRSCRRSGSPGPWTYSHRSSEVISGSSMSAIVASTISPRWCGGMLVAMPTAMPGRAVDEQVRQLGRQHRRLLLRAVVVVDEVDRFLVDVGQHLGRRSPSGGPRCSASRRRCRRRPSRSCPGRRRAGSASRSPGRAGRGRRTARLSPCGWYLPITSPTIAAHLRYELVARQAHLAHRVQDPAVDRLEAVADIGQGARHDDAHRVIEVADPHLVLDADRSDVAQVVGHVRITPVGSGNTVRGGVISRGGSG